MKGKPVQGRMTADGAGEVVVFLVGMRINNWWAVRSWLPTLRAMVPMMKELGRNREWGMLGYRSLAGVRNFGVLQYWESKEKLLAYASDQGGAHRPAWAAFNRRAREGRGGVGIWHETFVVREGAYENVYVDMPPSGLGAARGVVPVGRRGERAAERLAA
ncbi:DUF4188 domain-containing protein [Streptomyces sp. NPDC001339]|uniref:DUF4188 domain-containing protein n=1 Tax=Streptomyces sp. NPDC001339 TaxID=3364563 RepID=UPI0036CC58C2